MVLVFRKTFLCYPFNGTSSEDGSRNCFEQKIRANFDTGLSGGARLLAFLVLILYTVVLKHLNYVKTLCKDSRKHDTVFHDFYSIFRFSLFTAKISILKRQLNP